MCYIFDTEGFAGTERHVLELMQAFLASGGVAPVLACRAGTRLYDKAETLGLNVHGLWSESRLTRLIDGMFSTRKLAHRLGIDLLHANNGRTTLTAAAVSAWTGVPAVATQHFIEPQFTSYRGPKRVAANVAHNWVNSRLTRVICVSECARDAMLSREHIDPNKVCTVHNGITPVTAGNAEDHSNSLATLGAGIGDMLVVCISRLSPEKGLVHLVDAMGILRGRYAHVKLAVIGDGPDKASLEQRVRDSGLAGFVTFLGFREDATILLNAADIFVLPSPAEPFGLAILEAMSLGKPIVACKAGGPAEILTDGFDGILVEPSDPAALAGAIGSLLIDAALRDRLGAEARAAFAARFQSSQMAERTLGVYRSAMGDSPLANNEGNAVAAMTASGGISDQPR